MFVYPDYWRQRYCYFFSKFGQGGLLVKSQKVLCLYLCPTLNSKPKQTPKYFWLSKFYHNCWWIFRRCFLIQSETAILRFNFPDLQLIEFLFHNKKLISIFRYGKMPWPHSFDFRCQFLEKFINIQSFFWNIDLLLLTDTISREKYLKGAFIYYVRI